MREVKNMKRLSREEVVVLVEECESKLRELKRLLIEDEMVFEGDEIVENFFYNVKDMIEF